MHVLVTGGCGYIGSHTVVALIEAGHRVSVVDSLVNSSPEALVRVGRITGQEVPLARLDLRDRAGLDAVVAADAPDAVIHFAGLKAVGESVDDPLGYYDNNVGGTTSLLGCLRDHGVRRVVFSSSATVYGDPVKVPIPEAAAIAPTNPYGRTKSVVEEILADLAATGDGWRITALRYFNPVGAHPSGLIGEDPRGTPNNLLPYVAQVAVGRRPELAVFGDDWDTPDGTGVRDYIHVLDLAAGHLAALGHLPDGFEALNLGTGRGTSVLELVHAFEEAADRVVPYRVTARRPGDVAVSYADPSRAEARLEWRATRSVADACDDAWRWQEANPEGYAS